MPNLKPTPPEAKFIGNWVRLRPVLYESASGKLRTDYWVVEYENCVGGQVGYRFKTRYEARAFQADIEALKPNIRSY